MCSVKDRAGEKYSRLNVISRALNDKYGKAMWNCKCDCGSEIIVLGRNLQSGNTTSCGCLGAENRTKSKTTHGLSGIPEYKVWESMIQRCYNANTKAYKHYGRRGITVVDRWRYSFANFIADLGRRPATNLTLERKDNDKGYSPDNCIWADWITQANNKRPRGCIENA